MAATPTEGAPLAAFDPRATYDAAADAYESATRRFWGFVGEQVVSLVAPRPGEAALDVACGSGAATLPLADAVGPTGRVVAFDDAPRMLRIVGDKTATTGRRHVELVPGDMRDPPFAPRSFDVVVCSLGIFFVDDMVALVRRLWALVAPGGRLGLAVLGPQVFEPVVEPFLEAARDERADVPVLLPWRRTDRVTVVEALLRDGGVPGPTITEESRPRPLDSPDDWWDLVLGSGLRRIADDLGPDAAARVRARTAAWIEAHQVDEVVVDAIYATSTRPR